MNKYVTDTQVLVKFLNGKKVINDTIDAIFKNTDQGKNIIVIPSVVVFEIGYLYEKHRIPISIEDVKDILEDSINVCRGKTLNRYYRVGLPNNRHS